MKNLIAFSVLLAALVSATIAEDAVRRPKPTAAEAEAKAAEWIRSLGDKGLVIDEKHTHPDDAGFVGRPIPGSENVMFVLSDDRYSITLGFEGSVDETTSLETLRDRFSYIALDKIPTPGLEVAGWNISPRTPKSSLSKDDGAVEFIAAGDGKITIRVKTHFFALSGSDPAVLVPADAPSPPGSYFQIRERIDLDLILEAPFAMGE